jgi:subtilisin
MSVDPILPYNPSGVNTDWGVSRVHPSYPWNQGNYGKTMGGTPIKVCVIDTGINSAHEAFWKNGICVFKGGYNFVGANSNPADDHDHGTFCAGIVCAQHNGILGSYRGLAPDIELYCCKVLDSKGSGSLANVAAGVDWATSNGMDVISMSLGGASGTTTLQAACDAAWYAGIILMVAAGNSGPGPNTVSYPAKYPSCVAIAATTVEDNVAVYSSRGSEVELSCPGSYIVGPWAGFTYGDRTIPGSGDRYMVASGTSAATPHAAACAALVKSWYPYLTNLEIRMLLRNNAYDL